MCNVLWPASSGAGRPQLGFLSAPFPGCSDLGLGTGGAAATGEVSALVSGGPMVKRTVCGPHWSSGDSG